MKTDDDITDDDDDIQLSIKCRSGGWAKSDRISDKIQAGTNLREISTTKVTTPIMRLIHKLQKVCHTTCDLHQ